MQTILIVFHVLICLLLIAIILLQHGKGASIGASFGSSSSQTVFGTEGPMPLMNKITTTVAIFFMVTSVALAYFSSRVGDGSVMEQVQPPAAMEYKEPAPAENDEPESIPLPAGSEDTPQEFPGQE
ncbi:MAG: preprotein translocase subunit SecG [Desulfurivibrio sp.]|nr:preprotein translocase subunit SecG [Desulfurivibrio sp.]